MNIEPLLLLVLFVALLSACDSEPKATFGFNDDTMREDVINGLNKQHIWFRQEKAGKITIYKKDLRVVEELGAKSTAKIIPFGRSVNVNSRAQSDILAALDKAGVKYHLATYGANNLPKYAEDVGMSAEWIVFESGQESKGFEVVNAFNRNFDPERYYPEKFGEQQKANH
jgi:hypothetical protein